MIFIFYSFLKLLDLYFFTGSIINSNYSTYANPVKGGSSPTANAISTLDDVYLIWKIIQRDSLQIDSKFRFFFRALIYKKREELLQSKSVSFTT